MGLNRSALVLAFGVLAGLSSGQGLSLEEALRLARSGNGDVRAAFLNYEAAKAGARSGFSAFLPSVTPSFERGYDWTERYTGPFRGSTEGPTTSALVDVRWRLLDNGARSLAFRRLERNAEATELTALQTLRSTLFSVHTRFFDALRSQELLRVQEENLRRARSILEQTRVRALPPIEDVPRKDILQAEADFQNARVSFLGAQNRVATTEADLKAVLAWEEARLPGLVAPSEDGVEVLEITLDEAFARGLAARADLAGARKRIEAQQLTLESTRRDGLVQFSLDASYRRVFAEDPFQQSQLVFGASIPLFDGARSRENVRAEQLTLEALRAVLGQDERRARAEIESAFQESVQNRLRLEAARAALEAARVNFEAAVAAQREGAGTLIEVLTAQVSLTTAESNLVEARYDLLISDVRFRLVTGAALPGESG